MIFHEESFQAGYKFGMQIDELAKRCSYEPLDRMFKELERTIDQTNSTTPDSQQITDRLASTLETITLFNQVYGTIFDNVTLFMKDGFFSKDLKELNEMRRAFEKGLKKVYLLREPLRPYFDKIDSISKIVHGEDSTQK